MESEIKIGDGGWWHVIDTQHHFLGNLIVLKMSFKMNMS